MRRGAVVAAVVALHGLLWLLLRHGGPTPRDDLAVRLAVRMLPAASLPPPSSIAPLERPPATEPRPTRAPSGRPQARPTSDARSAPLATTPPAATSATPAEPSPRAIAGAPAASGAASKPLDLRWRGGGLPSAIARTPALHDPRASRQPVPLGEQMARALGSDDRLVDEIRPDGSVRIRRGTECVDFKETQAARLFAFDRATRPMPRSGSPCP